VAGTVLLAGLLCCSTSAQGLDSPAETAADKARLKAVTERILSLSTCGHRFWGGDSRSAHAFVQAGDGWLDRGNLSWEQARKARAPLMFGVARRQYEAATEEYVAARQLVPHSFRWNTSQRPRPISEGYRSEWHEGTRGRGERPRVPPEIWGLWNQVPVE